MAKFSLRRYDNQAQVSAVLSALSVLPLIALVAGVLRKFNWDEKMIYYGPTSRLIIMGAAMATILLAGIGFGFGLNSAGQRRNDKQKLSWVGFFIGALVLAVAAVVLFLFMTRGEAIIIVS